MDDVTYIKMDVTMRGGRTRDALCANIAKLDGIIDQLLNTALVSVTNGDKASYELDTGQTKTKVEYTDITMVTNAIAKYETLRQFYANMLTPRMVRLIDGKNFRT